MKCADVKASTIEEQWYESHVSILFTPAGEIPQTKGPWTDYELVAEMIGHLQKEHGTEVPMLVVSSRCGSLDVTEANQWVEEMKAHIAWAEQEAAYIKAGICAQCGACSLKESQTKCQPSSVGDSGEFSCEGDRLWEDQQCALCGDIATCRGSCEGQPEVLLCGACCLHSDAHGHSCRPISQSA